MGTGASKGGDDFDMENVVVSDPVVGRGGGASKEVESGYAVYSSSEDGAKRLPPQRHIPSADDPGMHAMAEESRVKRSSPRPMWYMLVPLLVIFGCLVITAGIRCRLDEDCSLLSTPSLGHFLNNTDTSALAVSSLNALMGVHCILNAVTILMLKQTSACSVILMIIVSILLYAAVYACLLFPQWYIATAALAAGGIWGCAICHGLRKYYAYRRWSQKIALFDSLCALSAYMVAMVVYIVFSAVPTIEFQSKQTIIFAFEIILLISGVLFCALLVFHTRGVAYMFQVRKSYIPGFDTF